jgi:hypothetical protein
MTINDYLLEMEFVTKDLISKIWDERTKLSELEIEIKKLELIVSSNYQRAESIWMNAEDPDDVAMGAGVYWENYFGDDKDLHHKKLSSLNLSQQVDLHQFAIAQLSGSLLQFAKQGISIVHGDLANCPDGRLIGTQPLKDIIWQARNQAIHWEEGSPRQKVVDCFNKLTTEKDALFSAYLTKNLAFEVINILEWKDYKSFERDMISLG